MMAAAIYIFGTQKATRPLTLSEFPTRDQRGHVRTYRLSLLRGATIAPGGTMYVCHREELSVCTPEDRDTGTSSRRNADNNPREGRGAS